jgi:hypothetical protein
MNLEEVYEVRSGTVLLASRSHGTLPHSQRLSAAPPHLHLCWVETGGRKLRSTTPLQPAPHQHMRERRRPPASALPAGGAPRQGLGQHAFLHGRRLARPLPGRQGPVGTRAGDGHVSASAGEGVGRS